MQIRLEDAVPFQAENVIYLNDQLIRFQLECPRRPSAYQRFFMGEYFSAHEVFPEAPNRKAIEYNLASLAKTLDASLATLRDVFLDAGGALMSRRDLLSFYIDHFCRPTFLYTNGQAIVSVVQRNPARCEVVYHPSLRYFNEFDSDYGGIADPISVENLLFASSLEDAERVARERLGHPETWVLRLRKGAELSELRFQPAGSTKGPQGYPLETLIASFRAHTFLVEMGGPPWGAHEPYRVLNELRPEGFVIEVCATCLYFRFSTMARDFSSGSSGYCTQISTKAATRAIVSVRHSCPKYTFVEDENRKIPFLQLR